MNDTSDLSYFGALSREARTAIAKLYEDRNWEDLDGGDKLYIQDSSLALMIFRLKVRLDDPALFPRGKWATLQRLEEILITGLQSSCVEGT